MCRTKFIIVSVWSADFGKKGKRSFQALIFYPIGFDKGGKDLEKKKLAFFLGLLDFSKSGLKTSISKERGPKKKRNLTLFLFKIALLSIGILNTWPDFFGIFPTPGFL